MKRALFGALFKQKVREALVSVPGAEAFEPNACEFEVHGAGHDGQLMSFEAAIDTAYVSEALFFVVIDVGVRRIAPGTATIFVGISGRPPVPFERTWNTPIGSGPFKVITPARDPFL